MKLIKLVKINNKKYINVGGIKFPYFVEKHGEMRKAKVGPFSFKYYRDIDTETIYVKILGKKYYAKEGRRQKHYRMRDSLNIDTCKQLLINELTPRLGYTPNLENPQSFNEKINWLKLYNTDPRITICCDKYAVKEYAAENIGRQYVLPNIGQWDNVEDIDFDMLPDKFVIKVNWSSGFNIIVKDKTQLDIEHAKLKLNRWMKPASNSYYDTFNWGYKNMKPIIYAEPYIEQIDGQVYDYKFFMCNGEFKFMFVATDRNNGAGLTHDFFDDKFEYLPFDYGGRLHAKPRPSKPQNYNKMIELAEKLSKPFPFVRVDFYEVDNKVYLGEMTFYPGGGTLFFDPVEWDYRLGEMIDISNVKKGY